MKKLILSFSILALVMGTLVLTGCGNKAKTPDGVYTEQLETTDEVTNHVQIALENGGIIRIALYPEVAPRRYGISKSWSARISMMALSSTGSSAAS